MAAAIAEVKRSKFRLKNHVKRGLGLRKHGYPEILIQRCYEGKK